MYNIEQGDWIEVLRTMPDESVHCVVTSPPYWGLRDYGTARWEGGSLITVHVYEEISCDCGTEFRSDPNCEKCGGFGVIQGGVIGAKEIECDHQSDAGRQGKTGQRADRTFTQNQIYRDVCGKCGAIRKDGQLGLERTPEEYVAKMVEGFREVRRVLRKDGTLWLNLGDSYAGGGRGLSETNMEFLGKGTAIAQGMNRWPVPKGIKPKDLVGIPWMVAFALRSDGWYLRQDIIWSKPNPMPESVRDRCTKAHEYIFLMSKSERYFYDQDAIREPHIWADDPRNDGERHTYANDAKHNQVDPNRQRTKTDCVSFHPNGRNKRSVWGISTNGFPEAHFATFPPEIPKTCIKAGCPEGGTVLDPFNGAGTTGLVAVQLERNYVGIELNPEYIEMSRRRIEPEVALVKIRDSQQKFEFLQLEE